MGNKPNTFLVEQLRKQVAGKILLPGEGTGRNLLHASKNGWESHAFDISPAAQQRALRQSALENVAVEYWLSDFANPEVKPAFYDSIAIIDVHLDLNQIWSGLSNLAAALVPGGTIILEGFAQANLELSSPVGPAVSEQLYTVGALRDLLRPNFEFDLLQTKRIERTDTRTYDAIVVQMLARKKVSDPTCLSSYQTSQRRD